MATCWKKKILAPCIALLACTAQSNPKLPLERILPDMLQHLQHARESLESQRWNQTLAHAELILLERPIQLHVDFSGVAPSHLTQCENALLRATQMWSDALGNEVRFEWCDRPEEADVEIEYTTPVLWNGAPVGGTIEWKRRVVIRGEVAEASTHAKIRVGIKDPRGGDMPEAHLTHICAHELGHVLGLQDSPEEEGVMSRLNLSRPAREISPAERQALLRFRTQAKELRIQALGAKIFSQRFF